MPASSPRVCLWCALLSVAMSLDLHAHVAYVTHSGLYCYSCLQDPPPCSLSALSKCSCEDLQLSVQHRVQLHSSPGFQEKRLTVWYTSASSTARLLNNSEVKHLTLVRCGAGEAKGAAPPDAHSQEGYFAVQRLEQLTLVNLLTKPILEEARNTDLEAENGADLSTFIYLLPTQSQDVFLGRERGAAYQEQARIGVIYSSVLDSSAEVKAYTVQTSINSDGLLPFPDLHLPRLQETSTIYVSFVY